MPSPELTGFQLPVHCPGSTSSSTLRRNESAAACEFISSVRITSGESAAMAMRKLAWRAVMKGEGRPGPSPGFS